MLLKAEDGSKSYVPNQRYQRLFLQSCTITLAICLLCYTYVHLDNYNNHFYNNFTRWNVREVIVNTFGLNKSVAASQTSRERKLVLLWTPYFSEKDWLPSTHDLHCPIQECDVTSNRSLLPKSSAVILHWRNIDSDDLPRFITDDSNEIGTPLVALFNKEAPPNTPVDSLTGINQKIHLTITYRKDSDVYAPYGRIEKRTKAFTMPEFKPDRKSVCWLVSHCQTQSKREEYVEILKQYIDVEVFGKCGNHICPYEKPLDCYFWLAKQCKFYLSFENSICKDYATEKLYYALMTDMIPIVMGGDDYAKYLPPHSFINVANFSSPKNLAKYLHEVSRTQSSYLSYFKWKEKYESTFVPYWWLCDLCHTLHQTETKTSMPHPDFSSWWFGESNCAFVE
ncbi:alpha-(1,3)-fucosyltransferase C [Nephila pilipes]|uniref:Fucosyltransferase n=1 Tax=Nephila pilipes TaxID=299642 RepID=A0A8X6UJ79_NEPPI|nr:alpha-(1,3)-fucosyltransferase C [Nephila pilipes]GFU39233.1 alpha-(1,3)-fucosyltransferase C [Nephila pilipes]